MKLGNLNMLKRTKIALLAVFSVSLPTAGSWAMQVLDDESMAQATGQDGITINVGSVGGSGVISFDRISLQDGNGFGTTQTGPASIGYFTQTTGTGVGFYSGVAGTTPIANPLKVTLDADDNNGSPLLNANIGFASGLTRINLAPFTIRMTADAANHATNPSNHTIVSQKDIIKVAGGVDVLLNAGSDLGINVQLGSEPQGHMMVFSGGQIKQVKNIGSPIELVSYNGAGTSSLKFNFDLSANAAATNGIQLAGVYIDLTAGTGLTLGKDGALDKFNLVISDLVAGTAGQVDAATFNGLKNGSMGNVGVIGAKVTDLKVNIKGM